MSIDSLYNLAKKDDEAARDQLFRILGDSFRLLVQRKVWSPDDAEDIVQDALAAVAKSYKDVTIKVGFAAWANGVLQNRIKEYYRAKKVRGNKIEPLLDRETEAPTWNTDPVFTRNLLDCLKRVLATNVKYARVLNLHHLGYTVAEICRRLNIRRDGMYVLLSRARRLLKDCLEKKDSRQ